jgi:hypothetical protein
MQNSLWRFEQNSLQQQQQQQQCEALTDPLHSLGGGMQSYCGGSCSHSSSSSIGGRSRGDGFSTALRLTAAATCWVHGHLQLQHAASSWAKGSLPKMTRASLIGWRIVVTWTSIWRHFGHITLHSRTTGLHWATCTCKASV